MTALRTSRLVKEYGRRHKLRALNGIDIEVQPGEIFGLLGPNGAGKTTFVKCVLGLLLPTEGSVELFGSSPRSPEARRRLGFAPEVVQFPDFLSGEEVMALHARLMGHNPNSLMRQIRASLEQAGLDDAPRRVKQYSKGMLRRLALAQALLGRPELVILDEPTADLDPLGRRDVRNILLELRARGATVLLNSHLLSEVERVCDRVAVIHRGRLLAMGAVNDLVPEGQDLETVFVRMVEQAGR